MVRAQAQASVLGRGWCHYGRCLFYSYYIIFSKFVFYQDWAGKLP